MGLSCGVTAFCCSAQALPIRSGRDTCFADNPTMKYTRQGKDGTGTTGALAGLLPDFGAMAARNQRLRQLQADIWKNVFRLLQP